MKKDGKYRYSLQFPDTTKENRMVGELLERLGNRKSTLIVEAVWEYLQHHPELQQDNCRIEVSMTSLVIPENLKNLVWQMVEEKISLYQREGVSYPSVDMQKEGGQAWVSDHLEEDISQMLDNLDVFQ